ncbi:hypothetical protein KAR91_57190 [Candidatus Pacearchaeota archaeon]|nr:hypothetical protein [Candidatus Pacearchaeota archaeon]
MATSIFIAKLFAVVYLFIGLGMLMSSKHYKNMLLEMMKDSSMFYFGGILATIAGFLIVNAHNVWTGWPILISVIGWLALLKGFMLLVFPEHFKFWGKLFKKWNMSTLGVFVIAMGFLFGYFGFLA